MAPTDYMNIVETPNGVAVFTTVYLIGDYVVVVKDNVGVYHIVGIDRKDDKSDLPISDLICRWVDGFNIKIEIITFGKLTIESKNSSTHILSIESDIVGLLTSYALPKGAKLQTQRVSGGAPGLGEWYVYITHPLMEPGGCKPMLYHALCRSFLIERSQTYHE